MGSVTHLIYCMYWYVLEHITCKLPLPSKTKYCEYRNLTTFSFTLFPKDKHRDDTHKQRQALAKKLGK